MICWVIKSKGKGYLNNDSFGDGYGKLIGAEFYPTRKEAMEDVQDREDVVKIEIKVLD